MCRHQLQRCSKLSSSCSKLKLLPRQVRQLHTQNCYYGFRCIAHALGAKHARFCLDCCDLSPKRVELLLDSNIKRVMSSVKHLALLNMVHAVGAAWDAHPSSCQQHTHNTFHAQHSSHTAQLMLQTCEPTSCSQQKCQWLLPVQLNMPHSSQLPDAGQSYGWFAFSPQTFI